MKIVVFNDYCCIGNCALKVNLSILMQNKIEVIAVPTKIFSSHMGYKDLIFFEMPKLKETKDLIEKNVKNVDLIYVGYVDSKNQFEIIKEYIENEKKDFILDPILGDNGEKYSKTTPKQISFYKEFIKNHPVITPNLTEAILLTNYKKEYSKIEKEDIIIMAKKLVEMGAKEVIIKGFTEKEKLYTLHFDGSYKFFSIKKIQTEICGTGDAFSSLIALEMLRKNDLKKSIPKIQQKLLKQIEKQNLHHGLNEISIENLKIK